MLSLGIDIGSSSVKVSLMDIESGEAVGAVTLPQKEMEIEAIEAGWAEQDPHLWWGYTCSAIKKLGERIALENVKCIGITYQMHGLVCIDRKGSSLRKSIIWCDSRAVEIGAEALEAIGKERCLSKTLNSPGNFTASKMAWVKKNELNTYDRCDKFMLPGDYIAFLLSSKVSTTNSGLSEQILWDFSADKRADFVANYYGIELNKIPDTVPSIGVGCHTSKEIESLLGIPAGTPISYRAGDQPNNAFSLNVLENGEIAATGGTSGVVYGVSSTASYDPLSRVNTFLHLNHTPQAPRYGVLLCINGTGILNAWIKRAVGSEMSYDQVNELCESVPAGSDGVTMLPFGNGAERMLENRYTGAAVAGLDLNRHSSAHLLRAAQEGIAYAFRYGVDIMRTIGVESSVIKAGKANLFLSPIFRETLATLCDSKIELYNTDGSLGAARGAALGAGFYSSKEEAFESLKLVGTTTPNSEIKETLEAGYQKWKKELELQLSMK